ncbi:GNAT family N-acetyltransferase [Halobaculum sp. P14]|uniref:GNAT family N-acetyltransferase n=1 Tax=Halobaculum sp. P14 TaxID=3421638 RepID=UPI003EBDC656
MEYRLLGWPADGVPLRLNHERFAYAGKFVMTSTGKAVAADPDSLDDGRFPVPERPKTEYVDPVGAAAFNDDRTDDAALWIRYVTVRADRRGDGVGAALCRFVADRAADRGYRTVRIGVNNAYSYEALHKAGFAWTGRDTGLAELVLERPADAPAAVDPERYRAGLREFRGRDDVGDDERGFVDRKLGAGPPAVGDADRSSRQGGEPPSR